MSEIKRAIILVMDSFGVGASADAKSFGDVGADTLGHIAEACACGRADSAKRQGPLNIPNLLQLGLGHLYQISTAQSLQVSQSQLLIEPTAAYGCAEELSKGKDTPSGHWEIAGFPVTWEWGYFPETVPCFPESLISELIDRAKLPGTLGNKHASGTEIIQEYGEIHTSTLIHM